MQNTVIIIAGPTAAGKTAEAIEIAKHCNGIIINADSVQTYKDIPILSSQPTYEEMQNIPHKLFGYLNYNQSPDVASWCTMAAEEVQNAIAIGKTPILVGGSGFYIDCLINGISEMPQIPNDIRAKVHALAKTNYKTVYQNIINHDPKLKIKPENHHQVIRAYEIMLYTGLSIRTFFENERKTFLKNVKIEKKLLMPGRSVLYNNINTRFLKMLKDGALNEVQNLLKYQNIKSYQIFNCIGVKELSAYICGNITLNEAISIAQQKSRNYAKRQITWFKNKWVN